MQLWTPRHLSQTGHQPPGSGTAPFFLDVCPKAKSGRGCKTIQNVFRIQFLYVCCEGAKEAPPLMLSSRMCYLLCPKCTVHQRGIIYPAGMPPVGACSQADATRRRQRMSQRGCCSRFVTVLIYIVRAPSCPSCAATVQCRREMWSCRVWYE